MDGRNPFFIRYSEEFGSDAQFLKLFSPGVLNALPKDDSLWGKIIVIRSSPGGGKTSLLRLFTPTALQTLYSYRGSDNENYSELFIHMRNIGAIDENGPRILGAMLSCTNYYSSLEDLGLQHGQSQRLLLALLNARIVLAMLRSSTILAQRKYPSDLSQLSITIPKEINLPSEMANIKCGQELYEWACGTEKAICEFIDKLGETSQTKPIGHDTLFSLYLVTPDILKFDSKKSQERSLILLDDFNFLTFRQRKELLELIARLRAPTSIWLAERLNALTTDEVLAQGTKEGRDWHEVYLESFWRDHRKKFVGFARIVADKRTENASDGEITSFAGCLESVIREEHLKINLTNAVKVMEERIEKYVKSDIRFQRFIEEHATTTSSQLEQARSQRALEILIERDKRKRQLTLGFMPPEDTSDVRDAANLFLHKEFNIPYYYGFERLCVLASFNIEQFLAIAGEVFEQIISRSIVAFPTNPKPLTAQEQEKTITRTINKLTNDASRRVTSPRYVRNFLNSILNFCAEETYRPNAPYSPGVTGIAIEMSEREKLQNTKILEKNTQFQHVTSTISSCLAENLLEPSLNQKCKGKYWMILYLNRMFCVKFKLPVNYGGWRPIRLSELNQWVNKGYVKTRRLL